MRNLFKLCAFMWTLIRVVLQGQFPVNLFQFFLGGIGFDPQNIIVSGLFHHFLQPVSGPMPVSGSGKERVAARSLGSRCSSAFHRAFSLLVFFFFSFERNRW